MILITGGAGYIGSHTVLNLIEKTDYKIIIFDNLENGHNKIIFEKGDLRNIEDIENVFNKYLRESKKLNNVYFFGRLGDYKYYNMDLAVERVLKLFKEIFK